MKRKKVLNDQKNVTVYSYEWFGDEKFESTRRNPTGSYDRHKHSADNHVESDDRKNP